MGDVGDDWKHWNEQSKVHRTQKQEWSKELLESWCKDNDVEMKVIQDWQVRLTANNLTIDIYPQHQKYHNVKKNVRGKFRDLIPFVSNHFGKTIK